MSPPSKVVISDSRRGMRLSDWTLEPIRAGGGTAVLHRPSGQRYEYTFANSLVRGVAHPPFIQEHVWEAQRSQLRFRPSDVFIATFSKCGTTLAEQVVLLLLNNGNADALNPLHKNTFDAKSGEVGKIWTEMAVVEGLRGIEAKGGEAGAGQACAGEGKARMSAAAFDALAAPRILKTHAPTRLFLDEDKVAKVIYVTRNPFDACVSCYYHPKPGVSPHSQGMPFDAFCKLWLSECVEFGGWIDHTKGWRREYERLHRRGGMLWLSYEELTSKPLESIEKMAHFLGVDIVTDPSLVCRVAEASSFVSVKKAAQSLLDSGEAGNISHLRKGKTGDWRTHFLTDELFAQFESEIRLRFRHEVAITRSLAYDIGEGEAWKPYEAEAVQDKISAGDVVSKKTDYNTK